MPRRGTERLTVRLTPGEHSRIRERAAAVHLRPGPFLRHRALHEDLRDLHLRELAARVGALIVVLEDEPERAPEVIETLRALLRELL
jgi:hypothetical protein